MEIRIVCSNFPDVHARKRDSYYAESHTLSLNEGFPVHNDRVRTGVARLRRAARRHRGGRAARRRDFEGGAAHLVVPPIDALQRYVPVVGPALD